MATHSKACALGAMAKKEFQRLVASAVPSKKRIGHQWAGSDFEVDGVKIDVVFCSINSRGSWWFKVEENPKPDFYVCFMSESVSVFDEYFLYLIPYASVQHKKSIQFRKSTAEKQGFEKYQITQSELPEILELKE